MKFSKQIKTERENLLKEALETLTHIGKELRVNFYGLPETETFKYHYYLKTPAYFYRKAFGGGCDPIEEKLLAVELTENGLLFLVEERGRKIEIEQFINPFEVVEYALQQLQPKYAEKMMNEDKQIQPDSMPMENLK